MITCEYCRSTQARSVNCKNCGAPLPSIGIVSDRYNNGYIDPLLLWGSTGKKGGIVVVDGLAWYLNAPAQKTAQGNR